MKGKFALQILEGFSQATIRADGLFEAFLEAGYGANISRIDYVHAQIETRRAREKMEYEEYVRLQRRYHNVLAWLKRDGLIAEEKRKDGKFFRLTRKGFLKLRELHKRKQSALPEHIYSSLPHHTPTIVVFDIPEREKKKRQWLRSVLKHLGFEMVQKSVWIGKVKIQKEFIDDLRKLKIIECVEIFEITKSGSLRHIA